MKKIVCFLIAAAVFFSLFACQQTPDQAIIKDKSLDNMVNAATTMSPGTSGAAKTGTLTQRMNAQASYQKELADKNGKLKIHVNADVTVPNADSLPIMRVQKDTFSQETVDILLKQLVHGDLFSGDDYKPTKDEIQQEINQTEAAITNGGAADNSQTTGKGKDSLAQKENIRLSDLQKQLAAAPDTKTRTPSSGKLTPFADKTNDVTIASGQRLYGLAQSDQNGYESFTATHYDIGGSDTINYTSEKNGFSKDILGYFTTKEEAAETEASGLKPVVSSADIAKVPDIKITADEAKQKAESLIVALGIKDLMLYSEDKEYGSSSQDKASGTEMNFGSASYNPYKCVWLLRFVRNVNGIPLTYTDFDSIVSQDKAQAEPWQYENMTFAVDDNGIVGFHWVSPYKITGTVTQNSNMMSFSNAMNVFSTMSLVTNNFDSLTQNMDGITAIDINVDNIRFGLARVTEQDKRDSGLLVPAWDFFGRITYLQQDSSGQTKTFSDEEEPVLMVNAIDGSIIDRSLGY